MSTKQEHPTETGVFIGFHLIYENCHFCWKMFTFCHISCVTPFSKSDKYKAQQQKTFIKL